jgi:hypothetical protein
LKFELLLSRLLFEQRAPERFAMFRVVDWRDTHRHLLGNATNLERDL